MLDIDKKPSPIQQDVDAFLTTIGFNLPEGFLDFFKQANGAIITSENSYVNLWPLTEMIELNNDYGVDEFAPEFFIFGSDGGGTAYAMEKATGYIYEMPFIGMSREEAVFRSETFTEFLTIL